MSRNVQSKLWREIRFVLGRVQKKSRNIRKHGYLRQAANENIWHHIFRESFRTGGWKSELRLNMGRWAAGPAFFYVLHRILEEVQPQHVVELGLGESSKLISKFAEHDSFPTSHVIVEHSQEWIDAFQSRFKLSRATSLLRLPLKGKVKNKTPQQAVAYDRIPKDVWAEADLVLVDGPFGSRRYSRNDVMDYVQLQDPSTSFIILLDDTHRTGEIDTLDLIQDDLSRRDIPYAKGHYGGLKRCTVIASANFPWLASL